MEPNASSLQAVEIVELARGLVSQTAEHAWQSRRVVIVFQTEVPSLWVITETERLRQSLVHLLHYSIQKSGPGGVVVVGLSQHGRRILIEISHTNGNDKAQERSTGADKIIPAGKLPPSLTVVRRNARDLGGRLTQTNHPDGGACFTLELPQPETHR